jgi:hypothetical protein
MALNLDVVRHELTAKKTAQFDNRSILRPWSINYSDATQ